MTRMPWLLSMIAAVGIGVTHAASLHKAQVLYEHGLLEEAKHALADVVTGDSANSEKAGALYLLGTIALQERRYPIAARMWTDLIQDYPDSAEAREARSRFSSIPNGIQYSRVRVEGPTGSAPSEPFRGVLVTATSADPQRSGKVVSEVVSLLASKGVTVARAQASSAGTMSVLVLAMRFGSRDTLQAECYSREGELLWTEKVSGFLRTDKAAITAGLVTKIKGKIEPHIGDTCLPN